MPLYTFFQGITRWLTNRKLRIIKRGSNQATTNCIQMLQLPSYLYTFAFIRVAWILWMECATNFLFNYERFLNEYEFRVPDLLLHACCRLQQQCAPCYAYSYTRYALKVQNENTTCLTAVRAACSLNLNMLTEEYKI